jgi:uncharacterized protein YjiS (DUF1127 family)
MSHRQRVVGNRRPNALLTGLAHFIHDNLVDPMRRLARSRGGERELARLDDRLLRDIGLTRAQVNAAAYGLVRLGEHSPADSMRAPPSEAGNVVHLRRNGIASSVDEAAAAPLARRAARG